DAKTTPFFVLSLPRSGSTMLQRLLNAHDDIATSPEPWILLPIASMFREDLARARYDQHRAVEAIGDFTGDLPDGTDGFKRSLNTMLLDTYTEAADGARYFLDKTPRYSLIADEVRAIFPESPIIILWRNPLAVAASIIKGWGVGRWNLFLYREDLYAGLRNLVAFADKQGDAVLIVGYEDIVRNPEAEMARMLEFLDLDVPDEVELAEGYDAKEFGDPFGSRYGSQVSTASIDSWTETFNNPVRRIWARRYLRSLGPDLLRRMGYSEAELLAQLKTEKLSLKWTASDLLRIAAGWFYDLATNGRPSPIRQASQSFQKTKLGSKYNWQSTKDEA
ncbi:MAG: sulfotransferase family protein, partial [Acidimicrobiia bacterium]